MSRVSTANPFDLLGDENEDRTNVPAPKKEQKPPAPAKTAAKPAATNAAPAKPAAPKPEAAKAPAAKPAEAGSNSAKDVVKPAPPRDANTNLQEREKESRAPRDKRDGPAHRTPGTGGGDGAKRQFDRKSGTGRPQNEVKKGGSGKGNWGEVDTKETVDALKDKEEKVEEKEETEETNKDEKVTVVEGEKKEEVAKESEKEPEKEKEIETMTYDEYVAKNKANKKPVGEALKPRTVDDKDFGAAGLVPLNRGDEITPAPKKKEKKDKKEKEGEKKEKEAEKKEGDKKENLAAKLLTFASHQDQKRDERRSYGGREGRGYEGERRSSGDRDSRPPSGRGRGGPGGSRGGPRFDARPGDAVAASQPPEQKDFPSLSPHGSENPVKA